MEPNKRPSEPPSGPSSKQARIGPRSVGRDASVEVELRDENKCLKDQIAQMRTSYEKFASGNDQMKMVQNLENIIDVQNEKIEQQNALLFEQHKMMTRNAKANEKDDMELQKGMNEMEQELTKCQEELQKSKKDLSDCQKDISKCQEAFQKSRKELTECQEELSEYKILLKKWQDWADTLKEDNEKLNAEAAEKNVEGTLLHDIHKLTF